MACSTVKARLELLLELLYDKPSEFAELATLLSSYAIETGDEELQEALAQIEDQLM